MFGWLEKLHAQWEDKQFAAREMRWRESEAQLAGFWSLVESRVREKYGLELDSLPIAEDGSDEFIEEFLDSFVEGIYRSLGEAVEAAADHAVE